MDIELIQRILTGDADASDKEKHGVLMNNPAYMEEFEALKKIWNASGDSFNSFNTDVEASWEKVLAKRNNARYKAGNRSNSFAPVLKWAAAVIILLGLGGFLATTLFNTEPRGVQQVYTAIDTIQKIELLDHTTVFLNKDAILKVAESFNGEKREVILEGEAFFEVSRDPGKPFKIYCNNTLVKVLGTSFNVYEDPRQGTVEVNVTSGKVLFKARNLFNNKSLVLEGGEMGMYDLNKKTIEKHDKPSDNFLSWKTGKIKFDATPLDEVCETLSHDFDKVIIPVGDQVEDILLTVSFKNRELDEILKVISLTIDAEIVQKEDKIFIEIK